MIKSTLLYIGQPHNPQFVGYESPDRLAEIIWRSVGPSGPNREYLFRLEEALAGVGMEGGDEGGDEHVRDLAERVRALGRKEGTGEGGVDGILMATDEARTVTGQGKGDEQAETEKIETLPGS